MWARIAAAFQRLLSPAREPEGPPQVRGGTGDGRAARKRGRSSTQGKGEDDDPHWKRFKMGELMDTVKSTAEGVRLTTSGVLSWVCSQSASLGTGGSPPSPVPSRPPLRHRQTLPPPPPSPPRRLDHTPISAHRRKDPRNLMEDSSTACPQADPEWTPLPRPALHSARLSRAERYLAAGEPPIAEKRPLHSPRGLGRANGHPSDGTARRTRTGSRLQTALWKTPRSPTPGPSPASAPRQRQADPLRPAYPKTSGRAGAPESPRGDEAAPPTRPVRGPQTQRRPGRKPLSTVEETILREEKEIYKQLLDTVMGNYTNRPSLTRIYSPLSHRDLSGLSDAVHRLSPRAASEASSQLGSETPPHPASWADTPSSAPASSPSLPDASPGPTEGHLPGAADATSTGSDTESVIVVRVKKAPRIDPSRMPSFDAVHWINELMSMYDSRARERRRLIEEQEALAQRLKQQRLREKETLPKQVTAQLSLGVPLIEEIPIDDIPQEEAGEAKPRIQLDTEVEDIFIDLTEEMEGEVRRAFRPGNPDEVLTEAFRLTITRKDIHTLSHLNWLNDEVINFYMNLLVARSGKNGLPRVHAFNTFFFPKVRSDGYPAVRRWTKNVDIFAVDILLVPIHLGVHWCLAVVDFRKKAVSYYDSMGGSNDDACRILLRYLKQESLDKKLKEFDASGWVLGTKSSREIPQQMNGSDCGMFTCKYADYISRDQAIRFTQTHMPYFRRRMAWEILHQKLL